MTTNEWHSGTSGALIAYLMSGAEAECTTDQGAGVLRWSAETLCVELKYTDVAPGAEDNFDPLSSCGTTVVERWRPRRVPLELAGKAEARDMRPGRGTAVVIGMPHGVAKGRRFAYTLKEIV